MPLSGMTDAVKQHAGRIRGRICLSVDEQDFVPNDAISELASPEYVRHTLEANPQYMPQDVSVRDLVDYVVDQNRPAKKVFLILVYCENLRYLDCLRAVRFCDRHLPIKKLWDGQRGWYDVSTGHGQQKTWPSFNKWLAEQVETFETKQWVFMAPVFAADTFDYIIPMKCPLPIQKRIDHSKRGYSGSVYEVAIHEAHLQVFIHCFLRTATHFALTPTVPRSNSGAHAGELLRKRCMATCRTTI